MRKSDRQNAVREVIKSNRIGTQADLCRALRKSGIDVDQATVSRDIKELGLVKTPGAGGAFYTAVDDLTVASRAPRQSLLRQYVRSLNSSGNILLIKGDPGMAPAIGQVLDHMGLDDIIGTVAGDDTVLAVVREGVSAKRVLQLLRKEIGQE